jgi:putative ABC transport system permease protein
MIFSTTKIALEALWAHKLRSSLTILGTVIGVASVIAIISVLAGMMANVEGILSSWGANTVIVARIVGIGMSYEEWMEARKRKYITYADAVALEKGVTAASAVGVEVSDNLTVKYGNQSLYNVEVEGYSANAVQILDVDVTEGMYFTEFDNLHRKQVAVIGQTLKEKFFPHLNPLGKEIKIKGRKFTVIGVGKKFGSVLGEDQDRYVWMPFNTLMKITDRHRSIGIAVKMKGPEYIDAGMDQIRVIMRARRHVAYHDPDDFSIITAEQAMQMFESFTAQARFIAITIPFISIIVAGIVVMNIMMVSVTERTREIGIRKSVGAKRRNVLTQFLFEAVILSMLGGIVGLGLGLYLSDIFSTAMGLPFVVSVMAIIAGLSIPAFVGIFFGIYPAWKASKLDPIDALRFE